MNAKAENKAKKIDLEAMDRQELEAFAMSVSLEKETLEAKVANYEEQLRLLRAQRFGRSSEKSVDPDQISLFNEAEDTSYADMSGETSIEKAAAPKRKKRKGARKEQLSSLPEETVEYTLTPEELVCPECGGPLHDMTAKTRCEIIVIPAQAKVRKHVVHEYSCRNCERNGISVPIIKAPAPTPLIKGSIASASLASEILAAKYVLALPLYRQEEELKRLGINIPRQNLANWVIKVSKDYLSKLYGVLHDELRLRDICHIDETTVEVLHEPGRDAEQKSYMWIYGTGKHDSKRIVLFDYQQGRSGEHPKTFMVGFKGFMHTDGYSGYNKMIDADRSPPDIIRVGCWAHARRKYDEALKSLPKEERQAAVLTNEGLDYCNELFKLEKDWKDLSPEDRLQKRKRFASPIVDAYFAWVEKMSRIARGQLAKAVNYSLKQESVLRNYLLDGRLEISNNLAERAVRPFVIGRNNWLFANTPAGAESSAIVYSIVETAKANGLIPRSYMEHLLTMMPDMDLSNRSSLMQLLPWSETLPDSIRVSVTV